MSSPKEKVFAKDDNKTTTDTAAPSTTKKHLPKNRSKDEINVMGQSAKEELKEFWIDMIQKYGSELNDHERNLILNSTEQLRPDPYYLEYLDQWGQFVNVRELRRKKLEEEQKKAIEKLIGLSQKLS